MLLSILYLLFYSTCKVSHDYYDYANHFSFEHAAIIIPSFQFLRTFCPRFTSAKPLTLPNLGRGGFQLDLMNIPEHGL